MKGRFFKIGIALTLAFVGVGAILVMAYAWKTLIIESEISSVLFRFVLGISFWLGMGGLLSVPIVGVAIVVFRQSRLIKPSLAVRIILESIDRPNKFGMWLKWYLVVVGASVPLLLALQAFGLLGGPWVPVTSNDWLLILLYVASQLPMVLGALVSLQIPWVHNVSVDSDLLVYNYLWHDHKLSVEDIAWSMRYERLVFLFIKEKRIPLLVWVNPPKSLDNADEKHPAD